MSSVLLRIQIILYSQVLDSIIIGPGHYMVPEELSLGTPVLCIELC